MATDTPDILKRILADKRIEIERRRRDMPLDELREKARARSAPPAFAQALKASPIGLIAEVKRRSPSAGTIRDPFLPDQIARAYRRGGAQAVSVLIDRKYFGGGDDIFAQVRAAIELPMLYKEFVVDEWQIWHAAALGASAVLLIAAALSEQQLEQLMSVAERARLEVLLETHDAEEMDTARKLGSKLTGINNRDLHTFRVSLDTTIRLAQMAPPASVVVSESGIRTHADIELLHKHGIDAVLVGQQLLDEGKDPAREIDSLMHG